MIEQNVIEIEADAPHNACVRFRPTQSSIRGRWDWSRCGIELQRLAGNWGGQSIPGQRIAFNMDTNRAAVLDPLHEDAHEALREKIVKAGYKLPPKVQEHEAQDKNTWLFWMQRLVTEGLAKLVRGKFPEDIDPDTAKRNFITGIEERKGPSRDELLVTALTAQAQAFDRLATAIEKLAGKR